MTMAIEKTLKSYENCCRTCLKEETSFDIFMETLNNTNLADILISCTRLNVSSLQVSIICEKYVVKLQLTVNIKSFNIIYIKIYRYNRRIVYQKRCAAVATIVLLVSIIFAN